MFSGLLILFVFAVAAGLMYTRKLPALLALPLMAFCVALVAGLSAGLPWSAPAPPPEDPTANPSLKRLLFETVLTKGSYRLAEAMMYAAFGGILSQVVMRGGIAQRIVKIAAEYAGDKKLLLAFAMTMATAVNFVSITGLGAIIMVGSLVLPILVGSGLSPTFAGSLVLFGMSLGGMFNLVNWGLYIDVLKIPIDQVKQLATQFGLIFAVVIVIFLVIEGRRESRFAWAVVVDDEGPQPNVPAYALLTPIVPILLTLLAGWPIIPSFIAGILYGCLTTQPARLVPNLSAAVLEGLKDVSPVLGLFMGIGMTYMAVTDPVTSSIMQPFVEAIAPDNTWKYVAFFTFLAPLSLYRGPLNLFGLGSGIAVLLAKVLPAPAVMAAFLSVGQMQSVCDPTNTHNVWIAQFVHDSTDRLLRKTIVYVWIFILVALISAVAVRGVI